MHRYLSILFLIVLLFIGATGLQAETASGRITMTVDLSRQASDQTTRLWLPYPVSSAYQSVSDIQVEGNYVSAAVYTDQEYQNPVLYAHWNAGTQDRQLVLRFSVSRKEVLRKDFPEAETRWDPADYRMYLSATKLGPIDGAVKNLADQIIAGQTTLLGKAKAIYDWACENTWRNPETKGCGFGDVHRLLKEPGGKCADISSLYVALARAAGVPSREVFGIRLGKKPTQDISKWQHCWAEFFLPGYGWVPVDPADVRKMILKQNLKLGDSKTKQYRDYFWGGIDAYRVKLSEGRDLTLNPAQSGDTVNYLMYPFAQIGGRTLDWLNPEQFRYTITFRQQ